MKISSKSFFFFSDKRIFFIITKINKNECPQSYNVTAKYTLTLFMYGVDFSNKAQSKISKKNRKNVERHSSK